MADSLACSIPLLFTLCLPLLQVETRATGVEREIPGGEVEHLGTTEREFSLNQHANTAQYNTGLQGTGVQSSAAQGTGPLGTGLQGKGLDGTTPY
ncbi:hypothetical protein D9Q98_000907 [Chlorella vulgaris]|uniref:Uncharacterized protein n=1 Tax=Chlorella vulgaris TaxID=3077 RepID=A0A9D4TZX2_CHLVU|nr:hypothetical protein D9Q98_000907 [Chlorella vulgaris]